MFHTRLAQLIKNKRSLLCVGLDPDWERFPVGTPRTHQGMLDFCCGIVDATAEFAIAYKPQIAYFSAVGAEAILEKLMQYIKQHVPQSLLVLDAKRGDIGPTAKQYAREAFERYLADAVTLSPYMGFDTVQPFMEYPDKCLFLLCRTSNPYAGAVQNLVIDQKPLYSHIAQLVKEWDDYGITQGQARMGLVAGATYPQELKNIRQVVGDIPLLVPGVGAQGGDLAQVLTLGQGETYPALLINASRSILYASMQKDWQAAAQTEALTLVKDMRSLLLLKAAT